jgi:Kef-type K+ transport system membrane component KefB
VIVIDQISVLLLLLCGRWFWHSYRFTEGASPEQYSALVGMFVCFGAAVVVELACWFNRGC